MVRNYVAVLVKRGFSYRAIARQAGLSRHKITAIATGKLKATGALQTSLYNTTRRIAYQTLRQKGVSPVIARVKRRQFIEEGVASKVKTKLPTSLKPFPEFDSIQWVKHKQNTTRWQLRLIGDYWNEKIDKTAYNFKSFSKAHPEKDYDGMLEEAVNEARSRLGGTNWLLIRIISIEWVEYVIGKIKSIKTKPHKKRNTSSTTSG